MRIHHLMVDIHGALPLVIQRESVFEALLFTSVPIVLETYTFLDRNATRDVALAWRERLGQVDRLTILPCAVDDLERSWEYVSRRDLHKLSAVDATSFSILAPIAAVLQALGLLLTREALLSSPVTVAEGATIRLVFGAFGLVVARPATGRLTYVSAPCHDIRHCSVRVADTPMGDALPPGQGGARSPQPRRSLRWVEGRAEMSTWRSLLEVTPFFGSW